MLISPVQLLTAPDGSGRLFIVNQGGQVLVTDAVTLPPGAGRR